MNWSVRLSMCVLGGGADDAYCVGNCKDGRETSLGEHGLGCSPSTMFGGEFSVFSVFSIVKISKFYFETT